MERRLIREVSNAEIRLAVSKDWHSLHEKSSLAALSIRLAESAACWGGMSEVPYIP